MNIKKGDIGLYKESKQEIEHQLSLFIHQNPNPTRNNKERFHAAIVTEVWSKEKVDLFVMFSYGYTKFCQAISYSEDLVSSQKGWVYAQEVPNDVS